MTLTPMVSEIIGNVGGGFSQQLSPSLSSSYEMTEVSERLSSLLKSGHTRDINFCLLCVQLSKVIDYAVANNEVPKNARDLPLLLKQICQHQNDLMVRVVILVLMISVKGACMRGWFQVKEMLEVLMLADEIGSSFCRSKSINIGPSCSHSIKTVMERFYPEMNMGQILSFVEAKPGYWGYNVDFFVPEETTHSPEEKIAFFHLQGGICHLIPNHAQCLFVAQMDNLETSACIISPQQVNFLLNGNSVKGRTKVSMDPGPQMPTNVTSMLKYGTNLNLLQTVGQFNGHYIIVIAFMSVTSSLVEALMLQDFVQAPVALSGSDADIVEGPSCVSLNCPISYKRIRTPVKGHSCKHFQCFDLSNFLAINARVPSWRCPHCNKCVCYIDIRIDQNMVKVLKEVGEDVKKVTISEDGSWKAVLEDDGSLDRAYDKTLNSMKGNSGQLGATNLSGAIPSVMDLTEDGSKMDMEQNYEIQDRKPFQDNRGTISNGNDASSVTCNAETLVEENFWLGVYLENELATSTARSDNQVVGGFSESSRAFLQASPLSTNASSQPIIEAENCGNAQFTASELHGQLSPDLHSQQFPFLNFNTGNRYGRFPRISRTVTTTPSAVQALPSQSQAAGQQQRLKTISNSSSHGVPSNTYQGGISRADGRKTVHSNVEMQQHISRSHLNSLHASDTNLSSKHHQTTQNRNRIPYRRTYSGTSGLQNQPLQQTLNPWQPMFQSPNVLQSSVSPLETLVRQGNLPVRTCHRSGTVNSQQNMVFPPTSLVGGESFFIPMPTFRSGYPLPQNPEGYRIQAGDQRVSMVGTGTVSVANGSVNLPSEQNWRPAVRMRGSLTGRAYSESLRRLMIQPTQQAQPSTRPSNPSPAAPVVPSYQQILMAHMKARLSQTHNTSNQR